MEPRFKKGDHVWAKNTKDLVGRTGYVKDFDRYKREYFVAYDKEMWIVPEDELELVDPAVENFKSPILEAEEQKDRYIIHIDEDYLRVLYRQRKAYATDERQAVYNEVYNSIVDFLDGKSDKPQLMSYDWVDEFGNARHSWWVENIDSQWQSGKAFTRQQPAKKPGLNSITDAVEAMYHHTKKANVAYYWMVATVIATFAMTGLGKVAALMAFASLLFSLGQNVWQGVTLEAFIRKMDAQHKTRFDYYPDHISNGGWVLYIVKMLLAVTAIVLMLLNL